MSYDPDHLDQPLNYARFLLGDTAYDPADATKEILKDAEITALVSAHGFNEGVAQCAESILARLSYEPDKQQDGAGLNNEWKERAKTLRDLATRMRTGIVKTEAAPYDTSQGTKSGVIKGPDMSGLRLPDC
jgi:hypothetical protein